MSPVAIGFVILLCCVTLSRVISEKGLRKLSAEQKVRLLDSFSKMRMYYTIPLIVLLGVFFFLEYQFKELSFYWFWGFMVLIIAFQLAMTYVIVKKLKSINMPLEYIRKAIFARWIIFAGLIVLIGMIVFDSLI